MSKDYLLSNINVILEEGKNYGRSEYGNNEKINIEAQNIEKVSIMNVMGQTVYETSVNDDNMVIDVNEFPAGIYMINVVTDEYEVTKRISVVHW